MAMRRGIGSEEAFGGGKKRGKGRRGVLAKERGEGPHSQLSAKQTISFFGKYLYEK